MTVTPARRTTVVHVKKEPYDIYIGRPSPRNNLAGTKWANPYLIGINGTRAQVIQSYRSWLTSERPDLLSALPELRGKVLACWCRPKLPCHGDVLAELANALPKAVRTLRLVNISEHPDYDEIQLREDDIGPSEDTTGWVTVDDGKGQKFLCSLTVVEAILFIGRSHTEDDP